MPDHIVEIKPLLEADKESEILSAVRLESDDELCDSRRWFLEFYTTSLRSIEPSSGVDEAHDLVVNAVKLMTCEWPKLQRKTARQKLIEGINVERRAKWTEQDVPPNGVDQILDLALRVWLMVDCREGMSTGAPTVWQPTETIEQTVLSRFPKYPEAEKEVFSRFPRKFRAADLESIASISIQWTDFLDEHLRFDENKRRVKIFWHKDWLADALRVASNQPSHDQGSCDLPQEQRERRNDEQSGTPAPDQANTPTAVGVPIAVLEETLKSLDVLFPAWHTPTCHMLSKHGKDFHLQPPFRRDTPRLAEFSYWRERLIDIMVEFESPPHDWRRIYRDRRHPMAYTTFWLGICIFGITLVFGILATAFAIATWRISVETLRVTQTAS